MKTMMILACSMILTALIGIMLVKTGIMEFYWEKRVEQSGHGMDNSPGPAQEAEKSGVYGQALAFLKRNGGKDSPDIEERFRMFLKNDLNLDKMETEKIIRMSFWKNYVSLQDRQSSSSAMNMQSDMQWEKRLKQTGFAAKGIPLVQGRIIKAVENSQGEDGRS